MSIISLLQGILSTGGGGSAQRVRWADEGADAGAGFSVGGAAREQVSLHSFKVSFGKVSFGSHSTVILRRRGEAPSSRAPSAASPASR